MIQAGDLINEINFSTSRSSGPGGQNVNKVDSKVTLSFDVVNSSVLGPDQKALILKTGGSRITKKGVLILTSQSDRSQLQNKQNVLKRLHNLLVKIFTPLKPRKATKPGKAAKQKRLQGKKKHSEKKKWRQKIE